MSPTKGWMPLTSSLAGFVELLSILTSRKSFNSHLSFALLPLSRSDEQFPSILAPFLPSYSRLSRPRYSPSLGMRKLGSLFLPLFPSHSTGTPPLPSLSLFKHLNLRSLQRPVSECSHLLLTRSQHSLAYILTTPQLCQPSAIDMSLDDCASSACACYNS